MLAEGRDGGEARFVELCKRAKYLCLKFATPGSNGWPDRLVLLSGGRVFFVEFKRSGRPLRAIQKYRAQLLEELGFTVIAATDPVDAFRKLEAFAGAEVRYEVSARKERGDHRSRAGGRKD
jgi:hypothetical protein